MKLDYVNYRTNPEQWARRLGISSEAVRLYLSAEVIDLHTTSFIWTRVFGYNLSKRHRSFIPGSPILNQVDFPRAREAQMGGVVWDVTTNPLRSGSQRPDTAFENIRELARLLRHHPNEFAVIRTESDYRNARAKGLTACWISIQGGQAIDHDLGDLDRIPEDLLHRVTLVHFTRSRIGASSAARRHETEGLSSFGREFVRALNHRRILVDLSHINRSGFLDAVKIHDRSLPFIVSHTGVRGVRSLWRNLDDEQIRLVAGSGGTIGIIFQPGFLSDSWINCPVSRIIDHMEHIIRVAGEDFISLGSDFDGAILLPRDLHDITGMPKLVQAMLDRHWTDVRIRKVLGENYLRVVRTIRP